MECLLTAMADEPHIQKAQCRPAYGYSVAGSGWEKTALVRNTGKGQDASRWLGDRLLFFGMDSQPALKQNFADTPETRVAGDQAAMGPRVSPSC